MELNLVQYRRKRGVRITDYTHAICGVSISPMRKIADDRSEMISQVLFGETVKILSRKGKNWIKVECEWDGYIGWVDPKQFRFIEEEDFKKLKEDTHYAFDAGHPIVMDSQSFAIVPASNLINYDGLSIDILGMKYIYNGQVIDTRNIEVTEELILKIAKKYLYAPYLWGGRSSYGIDCSGFIQNVFKLLGKRLPRDASQQAEHGKLIDFVQQAQIGDVAFFENDEGRIHHVGLIVEPGKIMHASGYVRVDLIDHFGIYQKPRRSYTHKLRFIKRMF